jgi:outer membrane protein assembly factor BamB
VSAVRINLFLDAASDGGLLYALNAYTGALVWDYNTGTGDDGFSPSSPSAANGVVYAGFQDGKIYALDTAACSLLWQYTTGNAVSATPAVVNGMVYAGSRDDNAYAFSLTTLQNTQRPELRSLHSGQTLKPLNAPADVIDRNN